MLDPRDARVRGDDALHVCQRLPVPQHVVPLAQAGHLVGSSEVPERDDERDGERDGEPHYIVLPCRYL